MPTSALSLPVDVPWKRLAISDDMYATSIDADLPDKWHSSLAVLSYEPDPDPADTSGEVTTFLKIVASITGYNQERDLYPQVPGHAGAVGSLQHISTFYPAFAALIQIAVFPDSGAWDISQFPYFIDFQPKQREVVETKTDTGELVEMSAAPLNVTKSTTTVQTQATAPAIHGYGGITSNVGNGYETTVTDASREKRETTSFQTNLSQLYQLLDSYHQGTNRALFLTMPRPHLIYSIYTFALGVPRPPIPPFIVPRLCGTG